MTPVTRQNYESLTYLTVGHASWQSLSPVLETPLSAVAAPDRHSGFFTSIGSLWQVVGQSYNTLRGKAASGLIAVSKYLPPFTGLDFSINLSGGHHG